MGYFSIAIDGPAGAGKSTIAKKVAKKLGFIYVDTGAMYRAMALYLEQNHVDFSDQEQMKLVSQKADITICYQSEEQQILLSKENVNLLIRSEKIGTMAALCAVNAGVRTKLVELQQNMAEKASVVMDGRDIGTKVLPNAGLKIYLTASSSERARRRFNELSEKGVNCELSQIEKDMIDRDYQDMNRDISPLCQAKDAVLIDSSQMTVDEVVDAILTLYQNK